MKKKLLITATVLTLSLGCSMTVCAQPEVMQDGTIFDADYYAQNNPDVVAVLGTDTSLLYQHCVQYGDAEGREALEPGTTTTTTTATTNTTATTQDDIEFDAEYGGQP